MNFKMVLSWNWEDHLTATRSQEVKYTKRQKTISPSQAQRMLEHSIERTHNCFWKIIVLCVWQKILWKMIPSFDLKALLEDRNSLLKMTISTEIVLKKLFVQGFFDIQQYKKSLDRALKTNEKCQLIYLDYLKGKWK